MKFRKLIFLALLTWAFLSFFTANAQQDDKITKAVMKVYDEHIAKNPNDYNALFMRANQLYYNKDYKAAMNDVNRTIELAPEKEKELLYDAYLFRAALYELENNYAAESDDIEKAAVIDPNNLSWVSMKGRWAYKTGNYELSKKQYHLILQQRPRDYDAMFNMACIAVKQGDSEEAMKWVNNAVGLYPAEAQVYLNRAYVQEMLGKYRDACDTYLIAMSATDDNSISIERLMMLSRDHYDDVMASLKAASDENPRVGVFYRLRSAVAFNYKHYGEALHDLKIITDNNLLEYSTIYNDEAMCYYQLCDYDQAYTYANKAIAFNPANPDGYILRSQIELHQGKGNNYKTAMSTIDQALSVEPDYAPALMAKARLLIAQKKYKEALPLATKAVEADPASAEALMLRGWLNKYQLKNAAAAKADFEKVLNLDSSNLHSLMGFAMHELGRDSEAANWADKLIQNYTATGGETYYYAAALHGAMGNKAQAMKYLESCLANGYGGLYDIKFNNDPYVNLAPLRNDPSFNTLLSNYQLNFQER